MNAMGAIRGIPDDYDRWVDEFGCIGWGWPEMLETFLEVEDDVDYGGDGLHGRGGPIPLSRPPIRRGRTVRGVDGCRNDRTRLPEV